MNHWKSALSLALVPAFALTLLSGCQQTAAPPAESSSTGKGGHVIAANTWGVGAYPLDIIFEALTPLETSAGDLSIDLANNEFKVDKVRTLKFLSCSMPISPPMPIGLPYRRMRIIPVL